jgi:hypothetical protein
MIALFVLYNSNSVGEAANRNKLNGCELCFRSCGIPGCIYVHVNVVLFIHCDMLGY